VMAFTGEDYKDRKYMDLNNEENLKAMLFGVDYDSHKDFDHSIDELKGLVKACDMEVAGILTQSLPHPDNATYLGKGKVYELKDFVDNMQVDYCICESDLSPSQMKNLQNILGVPVWDHTNIILEIFSRRAKTKEAKLQVESAYLQFMLPRLAGMWQHLGRQGGGGGSRANKGVGEKQIELDRRQINHRLHELSKELDQITKTRSVQRDGRDKGELKKVALVGYTNAGKSSLMNRFLDYSGSEKIVLEKDMLFATLDTSIRKIDCKDNRSFLLSDTVGFIENLPHGLVKAFRSTLEEVKYADLLLIVLDSSDPYWTTHKKVTEDTLRELDAANIPRIYVKNKSDMITDRIVSHKIDNSDQIYVSAANGDGFNELLDEICERLYADDKIVDAIIPYDKAELLNRLHKYGVVMKEEYLPEGIQVKVNCPRMLIPEVEKYSLYPPVHSND